MLEYHHAMQIWTVKCGGLLLSTSALSVAWNAQGFVIFNKPIFKGLHTF